MNDDELAVRRSDMKKFGCPYCGCAVSVSMVRYLSSERHVCHGCHQPFVVVDDGVVKSDVGIRQGQREVYLGVGRHPRDLPDGIWQDPPLPAQPLPDDFFVENAQLKIELLMGVVVQWKELAVEIVRV